MKNALHYFTAIFFLITACEKNNEPVIETTSKTAEELYDELLTAYNKNDSEALRNFLIEWGKANPGHQMENIKRELHNDVYEIFMEIYTPFDIGRLGEHEWGSEMYKGIDYVIVQNKIYFDYNYDLQGTSERDSIIDFRPPVSFPGKTILYLTDNYNIAILSFLENNFDPFGAGSIMSPAKPNEESALRYQFLREELAILPGHWGGYWHIETHPQVDIHFNEATSQARAFFRVGYMFGEAKLEKSISGWDMISSSITMIE